MGWQKVAESDSFETLEDSLSGDMELPTGTKVRLTMDLSMPVGYLFSAPGVEYIFRPFMPEGISLVDVHADDNWKAVVEGEANSPWLLAVIAFIGRHWVAITIGGFLLYLLVNWVRCDVKVPASPLGDIATIAKWTAVGVLGFLGIKLLSGVRGLK